MLRRKSEFFVFLDNVLSVKAEKEEQKDEEHTASVFEEYVQGLLHMKMSSAVSEPRIFAELLLSVKHFD